MIDNIPTPILLFVGFAVIAALLVAAFEPGIIPWLRRGGPDYLTSCSRCHRPSMRNICETCYDELDAMLGEAAAQELDQQGWPASRDLQSGWPLDTGTKPD